jgi:hypothetical protein
MHYIADEESPRVSTLKPSTNSRERPQFHDAAFAFSLVNIQANFDA